MENYSTGMKFIKYEQKEKKNTLAHTKNTYKEHTQTQKFLGRQAAVTRIYFLLHEIWSEVRSVVSF
jgi:hypothetical protein